MHLAVTGAVVGAVSSFMLVGSGDATLRVAAMCLAFFSGGMAIFRLFADDRHRDAAAIAERDDVIMELKQNLETLEDRAWELRESDERQASILGALGDVVVRRAADGTIVYANSAAERTFATGKTPRIGEPWGFPATTEEEASTDASSDQGQGIAFGDLHLETVNGPRWFSRLDVTVRDTGADQPLSQIVLRDVTERRLIEEELLAARHSAESSNEAKSRFLATVSHEIRTPLNGILGMASLLHDTRLTKEQTAYIEALETSGETLLMLIDEVLDFSKVEAGKLDIRTEPVRIASLVENIVELLAPRAHTKNLEIGAMIDPNLPETVTLDPSRIRQILFNLAGNGIKFTDEGGVSIEVGGRSNPSGGSFIDFNVRDTGIGFDKAEADRLFMEFEQVDHGPARKFGGTGLGLAIAQRLARLMGGSIEASSRKQEGSVFKVTLPVPEDIRASAEKPFRGKSVAVVSSSRIECVMLRDRLALEGADVNLMEPGAEDLADHMAKMDLLIIDNSSVADSAGWLATARLAGCDAPAIVLIKPAERDRLDRLREAGFAAYLIRPVRSETLTQIVDGLLDDRTDEEIWEAGSRSHSNGNGFRRGRSATRPMRLLVAEDNDINRLLGEALLRKLGHEPTMVVDGEKAVSAAAADDFDAILMDLHMPGLDGVSAIQKIRQEEAENNRPQVPILMVTADVMEEARERAAAAGAAGYLTKPLSAEAISGALAQLPRAKADSP
jgi:signal transduction histidine kinase/CheY-like chemotaxis protein